MIIVWVENNQQKMIINNFCMASAYKGWKIFGVDFFFQTGDLGETVEAFRLLDSAAHDEWWAQVDAARSDPWCPVPGVQDDPAALPATDPTPANPCEPTGNHQRQNQRDSPGAAVHCALQKSQKSQVTIFFLNFRYIEQRELHFSFSVQFLDSFEEGTMPLIIKILVEISLALQFQRNFLSLHGLHLQEELMKNSRTILRSYRRKTFNNEFFFTWRSRAGNAQQTTTIKAMSQFFSHLNLR